jgi:putative hydrolase of the HAD superfamily
MIKAVIFDLDDTLVSEFEFVKSGFRVVSKYISQITNADVESVFQELISLHIMDTKNVFNRFLDKYDKYSKMQIDDVVNLYRNHKPKLFYYNDVIDTLRKLKKNNYKLGIITDGYQTTQKNKIEALFLNEIVDDIIITDQFGKEFTKPSVLPFELISKRLKVTFDEMIYVGDNPKKDFYVGSVTKITTVKIDRGGYYSKENYYRDIKENYSIDNLMEIFKVIEITNTKSEI